ncbi:DNA polymerase epsilon p12 subunit Dna polymerase epsilon subunit 4 [Rhodotorula toruloides]|uniref:DNA polymerase epsilon p12 subunit Dna polymerase epsilon subunit 4 n=1 Tax=Rhodotorula toruloides TaxID=5286 RepID=A0A511KCM0_RHOTO|nr:DNA polymerase epsilon p12 subunit Dna polymerase epsilon subunit 4 [Rhodotorula toruloides]
MSTQIPTARVNRIIKADKDVRLCSKEAVFLIAKATEHMIERMSSQAYQTARLSKKGAPAKMVKYSDLAKTATHSPEWFYLHEVIPQPIPLSSALTRRQETEEVINAPAAVTTKAPETTGSTKRVIKGKGKRVSSTAGLGLEAFGYGVGQGGADDLLELGKRKTRGKVLKLPAGEGGGPDDEDDFDEEGMAADDDDEGDVYVDDGGKMDVDA